MRKNHPKSILSPAVIYFVFAFVTATIFLSHATANEKKSSFQSLNVTSDKEFHSFENSQTDLFETQNAQGQKYRTPASIDLTFEAHYVPTPRKNLNDKIFREDNSGVLSGVKNQVQEWEKQEAYVKYWRLEDTGLYTTPESKEKTDYLKKHSFKYLDKRLGGEVNEAEEGSTLAGVSKVHQAINPTSNVVFSENVGIGFKGRFFQRELTLDFKNPFLKSRYETSLTSSYSKQETSRFVLEKDFSKVGFGLDSEYDMLGKNYEVGASQKITEQISARISSRQPSSVVPSKINDGGSEQRMSLGYNLPF